MVLNNVSEFVLRYIIDPIRLDSGYNAINTTMIALLFVLAAWLLWEKVFKKRDIPIDWKLALSASGWAFFGATSRVLEDASIIQSPLFITPLIYIWIGLLAVIVLKIAWIVEEKKGIQYWKIWGSVGLILGLINLIILDYSQPSALLLILLGMILWAGFIVGAGRWIPLFKDKWNQGTLLAQLWDGTSSFIGITFFGYWEKHILGRGLIEYFETIGWTINGSAAWTLMAMKLAIISVVLYFIDKDCEDEREKKFFKLLIMILGLILGLRNSLQLAVLG